MKHGHIGGLESGAGSVKPPNKIGVLIAPPFAISLIESACSLEETPMQHGAEMKMRARGKRPACSNAWPGEP